MQEYGPTLLYPEMIPYTSRIPALYGRNTALFVIITVRISVPDITDRIVRHGYASVNFSNMDSVSTLKFIFLFLV